MNALEAEDLNITINGATLLDSVTVSVRQGAVTGICLLYTSDAADDIALV